MQNIIVARYESSANWQGYVEPEDRKWILFIDIKGRPVFYPTRNKRGGVMSKPLYDKKSFK